MNCDLILNEIYILIDQGQYIEASEKFISTISELKKSNSPLLGRLFYEYAMFLFHIQEYEMSLLMFQSAFNLSYMKEDIISFIYDSFVIPNEHEFEETYKRNVLLYAENIIATYIPDYHDLFIDFIPYGENKYFIYNKLEQKFEGFIDISVASLKKYKIVKCDNRFSDIVLSGGWNVNNFKDVILSNKSRILYYITSNLKMSLSFFKIPNIMETFCNNLRFIDSIETFQTYFHINVAEYLPRLYYGKSSDNMSNEVSRIIKEEHQYRLTTEGRSTKNVLLTIAIPSYNRGHRALKNIKNLIQSEYDAEVEFVISNNGSIKNTEGYDEIQKIKDSRINYFKYETNQGSHVNFCQVIHISHGKYTCLLSDEDAIYLPAFTHYLYVFKSNPNISFAIGSGKNYYTSKTACLYEKGRAAFINSFLISNYISGLIYRTDLFHSLNMYKWTLDNMIANKAVDYYAHSCWVMFFTLHGDFYRDNNLFFLEGNPEPSETVTMEKNNLSSAMLPYSTLESRIEQHYGFIEILNQFTELIDRDTYLTAYTMLCYKTFMLVSLVKSKYDALNVKWDLICDKILECCINGITKLSIVITEQEGNWLVSSIKEYYKSYLAFT